MNTINYRWSSRIYNKQNKNHTKKSINQLTIRINKVKVNNYKELLFHGYYNQQDQNNSRNL